MHNRERLVFNTAIMTGASLLAELIAMSFQVWLASKIGAGGIGLYRLTLSVSVLCTAFAVSGIRFAATRLVSEELGSVSSDPGGAMRRCFLYSAFFGVSAALILFFTAEPIGFLWIGDARCVKPLRIMAFALPFISFSSVMSGYFTACGRVWKPTAVHLCEQLLAAALIAVFLTRSPDGDIEAGCCAVMRGSVCSDIVSFLMMLCFYLSDIRRERCSGTSAGLTARMLRVALPLALSSYARSALSTFEHMLVPRGLRASGSSADAALASYGTIQGMVMPVISFPACILMALSELIVPELTVFQVRGDRESIQKTVISLSKKSGAYSCAAALFIFCFSEPIGYAVYHSYDAGHFIRLLAPLIPVMYTDLICDGCLKGLGQQLRSMGINILDAFLGVVLVWKLLPLWSINGYIFIIYFNECLNFALSMLRLKKAVTEPFSS